MQRRIMYIGLAMLAIIGGLIWMLVRKNLDTPNNNTVITNTVNQPSQNLNTVVNVNSPVTNTNTNVATNTNQSVASVVVPMENFYNRITKKPFGIYITKATSPVSPERFQGYHAASDAEATTAEAKTNVSVFAIADGTVVYRNTVNGYGGLVIIKHTINKEKVQALYGHVRLSSVTVKNGQSVKKGQRLGYLGTGYSAETDGERKHLHFAIIKGWTLNVKGYVQNKSQLSAWYDPVAWLKANGAN